MLDVAFIRDNLAKVKENCENRGVKADVDRVVALDDERKRLASETQKIQQRQNEVAKSIPTDLFTPIFAIARSAGWLAHWLEQLQNNRIYRPDQDYVGKRNADYVPLEKRP